MCTRAEVCVLLCVFVRMRCGREMEERSVNMRIFRDVMNVNKLVSVSASQRNSEEVLEE